MHQRRRKNQVPAKIVLPGDSVEAINHYCDAAASELSRLTGRRGTPSPDSGRNGPCYHIEDPVLTPRLRIQRAHQKHLLPRMTISLFIDGSTGHASLHVAGCRIPWQNSLSALSLAQWAASVTIPVFEDRVGVLRIVKRTQFDFDGRGPNHTSSDHLVDLEQPEACPLLDGNLCEAILWTWSGKGDRQVVPPRYTD